MNITGLFEIHITVDTSQGYYPLWQYTHDKKDFKLIHAVSETGDYREQYMISKWKNGTYEELVTKTTTIVEDMQKHGIKILRAKIESMAHNQGVPVTDQEFINFITENQLTGEPYFEYHGKIDLVNNNLQMLNNWCDNMSNKYPDVYLATSTNICGSKVPLLTIRIYNHGREYAEKYKNLVLDNFKECGFKIFENIQQEFSVYDTNQDVDKNWLIF